MAKPWETHKRVVELVTKEFFAQGDRERLELNKEPNVIKTFFCNSSKNSFNYFFFIGNDGCQAFT